MQHHNNSCTFYAKFAELQLLLVLIFQGAYLLCQLLRLLCVSDKSINANGMSLEWYWQTNPEALCYFSLPQFHTDRPGTNTGFGGESPTTNLLSHDMARLWLLAAFCCLSMGFGASNAFQAKFSVSFLMWAAKNGTQKSVSTCLSLRLLVR
jgi:hypothetical protein